jgi:deazaflavin-dependent oxidoreductase (nitroreductase family)
MSEPLDWNAKTIAEFRANQGRVGGVFEGAPMVLVHHRGRKSGREYVNPMMYLPHDTEPDIIYVFATKAGAPANPDWYRNLTAAHAARWRPGVKRRWCGASPPDRRPGKIAVWNVCLESADTSCGPPTRRP